MVDRLLRLGEAVAELGRARRVRVGVPRQVEGETVAALCQLGDASPFGEPLGCVLRLDPELVRKHLGSDRGGGEADHRALAVDLFPGGPKSRHGS